MMMNQNRVRPGIPTGGQFATSVRSEATGVSLADLGYPEPEQGTNCFHACPARAGGVCSDHGATTWSTHNGDLEVRGCVEDGDIVLSPVPDHEAQFFALYSAGPDGTWSALEDYDTREEAEAALLATMVNDPVDIDAVRAAVDIVDPHDYKSLEALAVASLDHLPEHRRTMLEATARPNCEPIPWNGSAHDHLTRTLYAALVDASQDVPTQAQMKDRIAELDQARAAVAAAHVDRDMGRGSQEAIRAATQKALHLHNAVARGDSLRERASLRRVLAGRPTVFDVREVEERHARARDEARRATNAADQARQSAINAGRSLDTVSLDTEAATRARAEHARQKDALSGANDAWAALNNRENR